MRFVTLLCFLAAASHGQTETPHIKAAKAAYDAGRTAQHDKQFQRASSLFREAIEIEPTFVDAHEGLISSYLESGSRLDAAASITQFLEMRPDSIQYRLLLGQILLEQKQAARALAQFSEVLRKEPFNADGLLGFAAAAKRMQMQDRATDAIERGRKRYPHDERFRDASSGQH
jgi:tetratricopeptide (TPR) repeat protein